jgi:hypothetical protein
METLPLAAMAENVTPETLPKFFTLLRNRPKPHNAEYEMLILEMAGEALKTTLWKVFLQYQDEIGEKLPHLTEKVWQRTYSAFYNLTFLESKKGIVINFPADRIQKKKRGRKPNNILQVCQYTNNIIKLRNVINT